VIFASSCGAVGIKDERLISIAIFVAIFDRQGRISGEVFAFVVANQRD
jgi:hypothetical protein